MGSLLLQDPVWESQAVRLVLAIGQVFEEVGDDLRLRVAAFIQNDVEELGELNIAGAILIDELD